MSLIKTRPERFKGLIVTAAAVVGLLHVLGALEVRQQVYRGYRAGDDRVVVEVSRGGPAERAGLQVGDRLVRIDGIEAGNGTALSARPRPAPGGTEALVVDRRGGQVELSLALTGLPPIGIVAYLASGLTGLAFLGFGLWALLRRPCRMTRLLALVGVGVGAVFTEQPRLASAVARAWQETGLIVAGVFGFAVLLHFMLVFPREARALGWKGTLPALYLPAALAAAGRVVATAIEGGESGALTPATTMAALAAVLIYFFLAVGALLRSYARSSPSERSEAGLGVLVACLALGLAPMIPTALSLVAPGLVFPGSDYYDLTWVLIPFAMARSTLRLAGRPA